MIDKEKMLNTISELFDSQDGSEEDIEQANLHYDQMLEELITLQNELSSSQQVTVTKKPKKKNNKKLQAILTCREQEIPHLYRWWMNCDKHGIYLYVTLRYNVISLK